jgi:hypothetical protein
VISKTHRRFWKSFGRLPPHAQTLAREKFKLWQISPNHPSLKFEERRNGVCVARVGDHYRAVGLSEGDIIAWFWIGTHEEYNNFKF